MERQNTCLDYKAKNLRQFLSLKSTVKTLLTIANEDYWLETNSNAW